VCSSDLGAVSRKTHDPSEQVLGFVGIGLDHQDGHQRLTRAEHFLLIGGSEETHEKMQETSIRFNEALKQRGKTLSETPVQEVVDLLHKALER